VNTSEGPLITMGWVEYNSCLSWVESRVEYKLKYNCFRLGCIFFPLRFPSESNITRNNTVEESKKCFQHSRQTRTLGPELGSDVDGWSRLRRS
jgi:hypothetical protein